MANGDATPSGADPTFEGVLASRPRILHGLCTYGIVLCELTDLLLDGDASRVAGFADRFAGVIFPGEPCVSRPGRTPTASSPPQSLRLWTLDSSSRITNSSVKFLWTIRSEAIVKQFLLSWLTRALVTIAASIMLGVAVAPQAVAGTLRSWNSSSNPLTVNNEGGTPAGRAYGNWNIATGGTGTESKAYGYLKDLLPSNGYNVYFKLETWTNAGYCVQPEYTSCTAQYFYYAQQLSGGTKETWNQNYWSPKYLAATGLNPSGSYARAHMFVQESNRFGDPSAGPTITQGNAY